MSESTYSVYLVQRHGDQGGQREVTSPVSGHELEFYDTGVWLAREAGRNFFPYEQIRTIREHPEGQRPEGERPAGEQREDGRSAGEQLAGEQSGEGRAEREGEDRTPERGESGAEEEMLE